MKPTILLLPSSSVTKLAHLFPLLLVLVLSGTAFAQNTQNEQGTDENSIQQKKSTSPSLRLRLDGNFIPEASFDDDQGKMGVYSGGFRARYGIFNFSYNVDSFSWSDKQNLPFGNGQDDPWSSLHRLHLGTNLQGEISDNWSWFGGLFATSSFEKEMEDSFGGGGRLGLVYQISERWEVGFGLAGFVNSISTRVLPFLGNINYDGTDSEGRGFFLHLGYPDLEAGYAFADNLALRAGVNTDSKYYRLADDSTVQAKGFIEISSWQALLRVDYSPANNLTLTAGPTFHFSRKIKTYHRDGDHVATEDLGNALGGMVEVRYKF